MGGGGGGPRIFVVEWNPYICVSGRLDVTRRLDLGREKNKKERKIPKIVAYLKLLCWSHKLHSDQFCSEIYKRFKKFRIVNAQQLRENPTIVFPILLFSFKKGYLSFAFVKNIYFAYKYIICLYSFFTSKINLLYPIKFFLFDNGLNLLNSHLIVSE